MYFFYRKYSLLDFKKFVKQTEKIFVMLMITN